MRRSIPRAADTMILGVASAGCQRGLLSDV